MGVTHGGRGSRGMTRSNLYFRKNSEMENPGEAGEAGPKDGFTFALEAERLCKDFSGEQSAPNLELQESAVTA